MLTSSLAISLLLSIAVAKAQNITYNVIATPNTSGQSVAVVVDNVTWPLIVSSGILYQGEAPIAKQGYHYAILEDSKQISTSEGFSRAPVQNNTFNEFFNRPLNSYQLQTLPQILSPLPSINRMKSDLHIQNQIPTIHIWGNETAVDVLHKNQMEDLEVELNMTYIGLTDVQTFENVKVSLSGSSSRYIPKLSYGIKMKKKSENNLFGYKNLKLRALGMDPSFVREYVAFSTINSVGLAASGFSYIRVFINSKPVGFYGIIETFQDPWLASEFANGDKSYTSGYLYQGVIAGQNQTVPALSDLGYHANLSYYNGGEYKIKAGPNKTNDEDYLDLQAFTKFISETNATTSVDDWNKQLDTDGFIRAMALENLLGFSDGYMTMVNNFYMYSDPKSDKMIYLPADLDTTIGISLFDLDMMISGNYTIHPGFTFRPLTIKFFSNPTFTKAYEELLLNLTQNLINPTIMYPFIDSVVNMIRPEVDWDNSLPKLGQFITPPGFEGISPEDLAYIFPPGFRTNWTDIPQTFESSLNGPTNSTTMESVKGFIKRKSDAILAFYKKTV